MTRKAQFTTDTVRLTLPVLGANTSKDDEILALNLIADWARSGQSYLQDLFTDKFVSRAAACIRGDGMPCIDIHAELVHVQNQLSAEQDARYKDAQLALYDFGRVEQNLRNALTINVRLAAENESLHREIFALDGKVQNLRQDYVKAVVERDEAIRRAEVLDEEIVRLKARLYDLEHPN